MGHYIGRWISYVVEEKVYVVVATCYPLRAF